MVGFLLGHLLAVWWETGSGRVGGVLMEDPPDPHPVNSAAMPEPLAKAPCVGAHVPVLHG